MTQCFESNLYINNRFPWHFALKIQQSNGTMYVNTYTGVYILSLTCKQQWWQQIYNNHSKRWMWSGYHTLSKLKLVLALNQVQTMSQCQADTSRKSVIRPSVPYLTGRIADCSCLLLSENPSHCPMVDDGCGTIMRNRILRQSCARRNVECSHYLHPLTSSELQKGRGRQNE